jgi:hypothetical protein
MKKSLIALLLLFPVAARAATCTHAVTTTSTTDNVTTYASDAFTPAANDLLVVFVIAAGTTATGSMTDSQGLGFTKINSIGTTHSIYLFVANALAAPTSMTVTFDCTGDLALGCIIFVCRISGVARTATTTPSAIVQSITRSSTGIPARAFAGAVQSANLTLGCVQNTSTAPIVDPPVEWTEQADINMGTPTIGAEYVTRDSGFTGTTITWGSSSATAYQLLQVEIDGTPFVPTGNQNFFIFMPGG